MLGSERMEGDGRGRVAWVVVLPTPPRDRRYIVVMVGEGGREAGGRFGGGGTLTLIDLFLSSSFRPF